MDSQNVDIKISQASAGGSDQVSDNNQIVGSISSEPLERYILDLRTDLRNELKSISTINW